jgi:hypothetical protein
MREVYVKSGVRVRLTDERWGHIVENHDELAGRLDEVLDSVADPDIIVSGAAEELLAVKRIDDKWLVVVYKEISSSDGFIITSFISSRIQYILKKRTIWKKKS